MANRYLNIGLATGTNAGTSWVNAYQTYAAAQTGAAAGDIVWVHANTWTAGAGIALAAVEGTVWIGSNDTTNEPPQTLGTPIFDAGAGAFDLSVTGGHWIGFSFKNGTTPNSGVSIGTTQDKTVILENCTLDVVRASANALGFSIGSSNSARPTKVRTVGCTFLFRDVGQRVIASQTWISINDIFASSGSIPTILFTETTATVAAHVELIGADLSAFGTGKTIVAANTNQSHRFLLSGCKLGASVALFGAVGNESDAELLVVDCSSGDNHHIFEHHTARGNTTMDTAKYITTGGATFDGTTEYSWKVTTNASASALHPYYSPWIDVYKTASTFTPYLEILRVDSATAHTDAGVYAEWLYKTDTGFPTLNGWATNRQALTAWASPVNVTTGVGTGSWTGTSGTDWSGKLSAGSITTDELGYMRVRVAFGEASKTIYVDPKVRV